MEKFITTFHTTAFSVNKENGQNWEGKKQKHLGFKRNMGLKLNVCGYECIYIVSG